MSRSKERGQESITSCRHVLSSRSRDNKAGPQTRHFLQSCSLFKERRHQTWPTNTSLPARSCPCFKKQRQHTWPTITSLPAVLSSLPEAETSNLAHKHITSCSPVLSSRNGDIKPGPQTHHFLQSCPLFQKQGQQTWPTDTSFPAVMSSLQGTETSNVAHKHVTSCNSILSSRKGDIKRGSQTRHIPQSYPCFYEQKQRTWPRKASLPAVLSSLLGEEAKNVAKKSIASCSPVLSFMSRSKERG